ncbi:hypothetical protein FKG94_05395 [Exilibacterium tricleocarpae]|uniref:Uncharacterized protein n=1 Tax=Exilibacterium tricleocarpae TaxID=2591008 RepID=A0A545U3Q7_9GAMM|nr:hypothetical protein [Exilibacterium tricleocarpae]TQV84100.1 hypothetical protein FKG94_05395 [Exilibacterium tricleocarpae]
MFACARLRHPGNDRNHGDINDNANGKTSGKTNNGTVIMGLFSRTKAAEKDNDSLFDDSDLPGSSDLNESFLNEREGAEPTIDVPEKPAPPPAPARYGIEDAIALMRKLPKDDNEVVVTVVNKTLESTHIQVADIVQDANAKETRLRDQHKKLETEIKDLQREIERRNRQIAEILADLKETSEVSQRLQLALELEKKTKPATQSRTSIADTKPPTAKPAAAPPATGAAKPPEPGRKTSAAQPQRPVAPTTDPANPKH